MLRTVEDFLGLRGIDKRVFKQASLKLLAKNATDGAVNCGLCELSLLHLVHQGAVSVDEGELGIYAGFQSHARGLCLRIRKVVNANQLHDAEVVGDDQAIESPFIAQDIVE